MIKKVITNGEETRQKFIRGVTVLLEQVGMTLGPKGRNVVIRKAYSAPWVTNDGVTVARSIVLDDETEDLAAQTIVDVAMKTNDATSSWRAERHYLGRSNHSLQRIWPAVTGITSLGNRYKSAELQPAKPLNFAR